KGDAVDTLPVLPIFGQHEGCAIKNGRRQDVSIPQGHAMCSRDLQGLLESLPGKRHYPRKQAQTIDFGHRLDVGERQWNSACYNPVEFGKDLDADERLSGREELLQ